jgi:hypothetical protein
MHIETNTMALSSEDTWEGFHSFPVLKIHKHEKRIKVFHNKESHRWKFKQGFILA